MAMLAGNEVGGITNTESVLGLTATAIDNDTFKFLRTSAKLNAMICIRCF